MWSDSLLQPLHSILANNYQPVMDGHRDAVKVSSCWSQRCWMRIRQITRVSWVPRISHQWFYNSTRSVYLTPEIVFLTGERNDSFLSDTSGLFGLVSNLSNTWDYSIITPKVKPDLFNQHNTSQCKYYMKVWSYSRGTVCQRTRVSVLSCSLDVWLQALQDCRGAKSSSS